MKKQVLLFCFSIPKDFKLHNKFTISSFISVWSRKQLSLENGRQVIPGSKNVKCSMTCFCSLKGDSYSLPKKKIFFLLFYSGTQYEPNCNSGLRGTPVQTDSPTWNCQSLGACGCHHPHVECGREEVGGPGLRLCPWAGAEALALGRIPKPAVVLTTKAAAWYIIFLFSYYFILTNCLQPHGFSPQQHLSATCSGKLCSDLDVICAKTHPWLSSILRQMMRKTGIWFSQEEHLRNVKPNTYSEEMSVRKQK